MKSPKIGKDNEVTNFYPEKKVIPFRDMTTELSYNLDAIPRDRNSYFTTRCLNVLQRGEVDNSSKWSTADRVFAVIQYGLHQKKDLKVKFNYGDPCRYCGKKHGFVFDYASLVKNYKSAPKEWPTEKFGDKEIKLKPMTGEFETLIEFQEGQRRKDSLNDHPPGTIEYQDFQSELEEHNKTIFFEIQFLRVAAHTGISVAELKALDYDKFKELLGILQRNLKILNYGIQFWGNEDDHLNNPGIIEYYHKCPKPDEEYMKKTGVLEQFKEGGLEAILITIPFRAKYCT